MTTDSITEDEVQQASALLHDIVEKALSLLPSPAEQLSKWTAFSAVIAALASGESAVSKGSADGSTSSFAGASSQSQVNDTFTPCQLACMFAMAMGGSQHMPSVVFDPAGTCLLRQLHNPLPCQTYSG